MTSVSSTGTSREIRYVLVTLFKYDIFEEGS